MKYELQINNDRNHRVKLVLGTLFVSLLIFAGACSSETTPSEPTVVQTVVPTEVAEDPLQNLADLIDDVQEIQRDLLPLTFNVDLTADGPSPEHLFIPSNRSVQIVLRNRSKDEVHYQVLDLVPQEMLWISVPDEEVEREVGVSDEDHDAHHDRDFVSWRAESKSGVKPTGDQIHGYTSLGELDVVRFVATSLGTFDVIDPLHPEFSARLTVY